MPKISHVISPIPGGADINKFQKRRQVRRRRRRRRRSTGGHVQQRRPHTSCKLL